MVVYPFDKDVNGLEKDFRNVSLRGAGGAPELPTVVGRSDYAARVGAADWGSTEAGPGLGEGADLSEQDRIDRFPGQPGATKAKNDHGVMVDIVRVVTGVCYRRSMVRMRDIKDGGSSTYIAGEKHHNPAYYTNGMHVGDDQTWDASFCFDQTRYTGVAHPTTDGIGSAFDADGIAVAVPRQDCGSTKTLADYPNYGFHTDADARQFDGCAVFGSAHANSFNMVFCDGSVHAISYTIDAETHHRLGSIADGQPVDAKAF